MIHIIKGDMFDGGHQALVNAVNCEGVMGAGLAKVFASKFPEMLPDYVNSCITGTLVPGKMHVFGLNDNHSPVQWIVNFPTVHELPIIKSRARQTYRANGRRHYKYVRKGLPELIRIMKGFNIKDIAVPALGCGIVGLDWGRVLPIMVDAFISDHWVESHSNVYIYYPHE